MAARREPKNGRPWTPAKVRERIRTGLLLERLEKQALAEDDIDMSPTRIDAAKFLVGLVVPKAEAPRDVNVNGNLNLTVVTGVPRGE